MKNDYMLVKMNDNGSTTIMGYYNSIEDAAYAWSERFAFGGRGLIADKTGNIVATVG